MSTICIVLEDQSNGTVDISVHAEGIVEGAPVTTSQKMAVAMMEAAKAVPADAEDIQTKHLGDRHGY